MSADIDVIESDDDVIPCAIRNREPIIIRGVGHMTMFGLNSRFDTEFPSVLTGRLAPEELADTMRRINNVLSRTMPNNARWLVCGLLFCCCTVGCSLWPVVCLNKRTVHTLEKTLDHENQSLYNKLGLHWRLVRRPVDLNHSMTEYVLLLEMLPKAPLLLPD
uniref:Golgin subfamily A member 7/ERF4 domain-containing protein n=1 Tax=Parascaris univalens TaxID=6257 RepID=A0A915BNJ0_PARUN